MRFIPTYFQIISININGFVSVAIEDWREVCLHQLRERCMRDARDPEKRNKRAAQKRMKNEYKDIIQGAPRSFILIKSAINKFLITEFTNFPLQNWIFSWNHICYKSSYCQSSTDFFHLALFFRYFSAQSPIVGCFIVKSPSLRMNIFGFLLKWWKKYRNER